MLISKRRGCKSSRLRRAGETRLFVYIKKTGDYAPARLVLFFQQIRNIPVLAQYWHELSGLFFLGVRTA